MKETRKLFVGNDYASVESLPGPMLSESGGGHVGSGGGTDEDGKEERARDGSIDESGWSASTMAGRAVNKPEEEEEEEEEGEKEEEEEEVICIFYLSFLFFYDFLSYLSWFILVSLYSK